MIAMQSMPSYACPPRNLPHLPRPKKVGRPLHFIQHDESVPAGPQVLLDVAELVAVFRRLQIKVAPIGLRDVESERGFTHLA